MPEWLNHPATIIIGLVTVIGAVSKIAHWMGTVDRDRAAAERDRSRFDRLIDEIRADIKGIFDRLPPSPVAGASPLRLTEMGREISDALEAGALADSLVPALRERAEGKDAYTIQELCREYVREEFKPSEELEHQIRMSAFHNGIKREQVLDVIAIELRDRVMQPATPVEPPQG